MKHHLYCGPYVHSPSVPEIRTVDSAVIGVDSEGKIKFICEGIPLEDVLTRHPEWKDATIVKSEGGDFFFPGFIGSYPLLEERGRALGG